MVKKILFVCLGNICRSPVAEGIFNQTFNLNRCQLDIYLSYGTRSCVNQKLGLLALDQRKNELHTIRINLVGGDLS